MLNRKEFLLDCVRNGSTSGFPVGIIDGGTWTLADAGKSMDEVLLSEDSGFAVIDSFNTRFDFDFVWTAPATYHYVTAALGGTVDGSVPGSAPELVRSFINSGEDIPAWDGEYIECALKADKYIQAILRQTEKFSEKYRDSRYVAVNFIGPFTLASQLAGMSEFMMMIIDEEDDIFDRLMELSLKICDVFYRIVTQAGADMIFIGDPTSSGDLVSPDMFENRSLPYLKRLIGMVRGYADIILLHICGNVRPRFAQLAGSGIDAFSVDSTDIDFAFENSGGEYAVFGNIPPVEVLSHRSADGVREYCRGLLEKRKSGDRFVLLPGCDIPPETDSENIAALASFRVK